MNDFFKQSKKQKQINEGLFDKVFGKKEPIANQANNDFVQAENGTYIFGGKSTAKKIVEPATKEFLSEFDWNSSKLRFVVSPETEFHANQINFDLDKEVITFFDGDWISGPFTGRKFHGTFSGLYFVGNFIDLYNNYQSEPNTFVDGTFNDLSNKGILGKPNTLSLDKLGDKDTFMLMTVPVGYKIQMRSANGVDSYIKVIKRLDKTSSLFQFEVLNGFLSQKSPVIINVEWQTIRESWGKGIYEIQKKGAKNVGNLVVAAGADYIKEMYVSEAPVTFVTPAQTVAQQPAIQVFEPGKKYTFDLSKIPLLNINIIKGEKGKFAGSTSPTVTFSFDTQEEFNQFNHIVSNIQSGVFQQDLKNISKAIKYGEIDGYGPYRYLNKIFSKPGSVLKEAKKGVQGRMASPYLNVAPTNKKRGQYGRSSKKQQSNTSTSPIANANQPITVPDVKQSMSRLNNFVYYFVENIVTKKGVPNEIAKKIIFDNLKRVLGLTETAVEVPQAKAPVVQSPGMTGGDIDLPFMKESIKNSIRDIINDTF